MTWDEFNNCADGGDYADWITHAPSQVQDAFDGPGARFMTATDAAAVALDAIGHDFAAAFAPVSELASA